MLILQLLQICCLFGLLWWVWRSRRFIYMYWKLGARYTPLPLLGHSYLFLAGREKTLTYLKKIGDHALVNGGMSPIWVLHRFYLIMADAVDVEYILKYHLEKDDMMYLLRLFTRTSSIFATVPMWRPRRKIVSTLLSNKNVSKFEPVFSKDSQILTEQLRPLVGNGAFSIWEHLNAFTVDATCTTILGIDLNSQTNLNDPLRTAINNIIELASEFLLQIWFHVEIIMKRTQFYKMFKKNDAVIKSYVEKALKKHTETISHDSKTDISAIDESEEPFSLLHLFTRMKEQRGFDSTTLHDESLGLLLAGSESTAVASSMACVVMSRRPDIQEKVYQELMEVFGDSDRPVTNEDLPRLKYLEALLKETKRVYPPVPHITRKALTDIVLPSGVTVPQGSNFLISIYALNRDPKYWGDDAHEFRPDRFLDGSVSEQTTYFAFSVGPRGCNGIQFAMMLMKTGLATLLRRYRMLPATTPDAPLRFLFGLNAKTIDKFSVRIKERKLNNN